MDKAFVPPTPDTPGKLLPSSVQAQLNSVGLSLALFSVSPATRPPTNPATHPATHPPGHLTSMEEDLDGR